VFDLQLFQALENYFHVITNEVMAHENIRIISQYQTYGWSVRGGSVLMHCVLGLGNRPSTWPRSARSLGAGTILVRVWARALLSKPGGYFPIGRTNVCDEEGCCSGGVVLSIATKWEEEASSQVSRKMTKKSRTVFPNS